MIWSIPEAYDIGISVSMNWMSSRFHLCEINMRIKRKCVGFLIESHVKKQMDWLVFATKQSKVFTCMGAFVHHAFLSASVNSATWAMGALVPPPLLLLGEVSYSTELLYVLHCTRIAPEKMDAQILFVRKIENRHIGTRIVEAVKSKPKVDRPKLEYSIFVN